MTNSPTEAAEFIENGGIVAFPTETVYGLGANVFDAAAVAKIFAAKGRPADNPLIAHVANLKQIDDLASQINANARKFIDLLFPGPLTLVLPKSDRVPLIATAGLDTIGVRMPKHDLARQFLAACRVPLVAPSANLSGRPSPTTWQAVLEDLDGRIDCILQGEATEIGLESTVVDCSSDIPVLLRQGAVSLEDLRSIVPETAAFALSDGEPVRSPGLKHKHYSPTAKVILVTPQVRSRNDSDRGFEDNDQGFVPQVRTGNDSDRGFEDSDQGFLPTIEQSAEPQPRSLSFPVPTRDAAGQQPRSLSFPVLTRDAAGQKPRSLSFPVRTGDAAFIGVSAVEAEFALILICSSVEEYAHQVFEFFRECDRRQIVTIYCETVPESGLGAALMDRLRRAAE